MQNNQKKSNRFNQLAVVVALLLCCNSALATTDGISKSNTGKSKETGTSDSNEKSKSERETETKSDDTGGGKSKKTDNGTRSSTKRDVSSTLDKMKSSSLDKTLNVVGLYAKAAMDGGVVRRLKINSILKTPIGTNTTYQTNLGSLASRNAPADRFLKVDATKAYMTELFRTGKWISNNLQNASLAQGIGLKDWEDLAILTVANDRAGLLAITASPDLSGECEFDGTITKILCGSCVLDLAYSKGLPELVCAGLGMFSADSAGGEQISVRASNTASMKEAISQSKSDESFTAVTKSLDDYVKWSASKGKAVEGAVVKRHVLSLAVKDTKGTQVALDSIKAQDDPSKVMGILGLK